MFALTIDPTVHTGSGIQGAQLWAFTLGFLIPLLVALVTNHQTLPWIKAVANLVGVLLLALLCELLIGPGDFVWQQFWFGFLLAVCSSVVAWFGIWHPTGVDNALKNLAASYHRNKDPNAPTNRTEHGALTTTGGVGVALIVLGVVVLLFLSVVVGIIMVVLGAVALFFGVYPGRRV